MSGCSKGTAPDRSGTAIQDNGGAELGKDFTLRPGESVRLAGSRSTLTFVAVPEDSRCPPTVQCIWAGNAKLSFTLDDAPFAINSTLEPREAIVQGYHFSLVQLTQRPVGDTVATNYSATLRVTK
ncbi:MAG TPA: hypothetical protein VGP80_02320 [Gemmatimonadales bacterium]|jgi:hypothetical protein|nr:hypothetical protein [Gemmatimonadales bacterium]